MAPRSASTRERQRIAAFAAKLRRSADAAEELQRALEPAHLDPTLRTRNALERPLSASNRPQVAVRAITVPRADEMLTLWDLVRPFMPSRRVSPLRPDPPRGDAWAGEHAASFEHPPPCDISRKLPTWTQAFARVHSRTYPAVNDVRTEFEAIEIDIHARDRDIRGRRSRIARYFDPDDRARTTPNTRSGGW